MSEFQYYEFKAIDRPLTDDEQAVISKLSSRVKLRSRGAVFTYSYGDFPGSAEEILAKYFDAMFYIANWGTKQLMFRFPKSLVEIEQIQQYCIEDSITLSIVNDYAILNIEINDEDGFGWIEETDYISGVVGLRNDILQQDYRMLYLAWLKVITLQEVEVDEEEYEPPVPSGLSKLSGSLMAFEELFEIDENLVKAAAKLSSDRLSVSNQDLLPAIKKLSRDECNKFLLRLANSEPNLSIELNKKLSELIPISQPESQSKRTIKQLLEMAEQEKQQEEIRKKQEAQAKRNKELEALAKREPDAWKDVDRLLETSQAKAYDDAVQLLLNLRDLATNKKEKLAFEARLSQISEQYSRRAAFIKRLRNVGLI